MDSFELFPKLPAEIKAEIWKLQVQDRVVDVVYDSVADRYVSPNTPPPAITSICRQSREISQRIYTMAFKTKTTPANIWVNFESDTIFFDGWLAFSQLGSYPNPEKELGTILGPMQPEERIKIKSIAITSDILESLAQGISYFWTALCVYRICKELPALKSLYFTVEGRNPYLRGSITLFDASKDHVCQRYTHQACVFCGFDEIVGDSLDFAHGFFSDRAPVNAPQFLFVRGVARGGVACSLGSYEADSDYYEHDLDSCEEESDQSEEKDETYEADFEYKESVDHISGIDTLEQVTEAL